MDTSAKIPKKIGTLILMKSRQNLVFLNSGHSCLADGALIIVHDIRKIIYFIDSFKGLQNSAKCCCRLAEVN